MENQVMAPEERTFDSFFENYENDRLVVLVRDPYTLYAYWACTGFRRRAAERLLGCRWEEMRHALRVHDVKWLQFEGEQDNWHRELAVHSAGGKGSTFISALQPDSAYIADFGVKTADGRFVALLRSELARTPPDGVENLQPAPMLQTDHTAGQKLPGWWKQFDGYTLKDS
ncbi:DUF4912 domain-containing protein [Gordoniibacillus kamchatkensis]|uniref:DUF4912 domain-containing protein n=1 Tax=Gordoniibacillus kamchatkensis TaxID=1590651 RepID=UPI0006982ECD|nr:DUF4912 domain-containing protein [Paenibacillus sp. VKM B-2647]